MNTRLIGTFLLRSPLSHIGESISTTSYLVEEPLIQLDGSVESVFSYSGNAWRGQLRDLAATYMLTALGTPRLDLTAFHLLFAGGRIGGDQVVDIEQVRAWRRAIPMIALWGGGIGNQILPGKLRVGNSYPVCQEAMVALPLSLHEQAERTSYRDLTFEKSFSRHDDTRDDNLRQFYDDPLEASLHLGAPAQSTLLDEPEPAAKGRARPKADPGPEQMRMTVELVAAGTVLSTEIDLLDVSDVELGCFVSALHLFSRSPHIGGQANKGHGRVALQYEHLNLDTGETGPFLAIADGPSKLAPAAEQAKQAYDQYLREQYDRMLAQDGSDIKQLLGVGG